MTELQKNDTISIVIKQLLNLYPTKREKEVIMMGKECQKPEKLKGKPGECSSEQIKECHGDEGHPCCEKEE